MQLTKGAIGNLINRYKAVLKKCHLMNTFGSLAVAGMLVMGGAGMAVATDYTAANKTEFNTAFAQALQEESASIKVTSPITDGGGIGIFNDKNTTIKNLTIDFNGNKYTFTESPVGSKGTESQTVHLEKDRTVTLKNGTLDVAQGSKVFKMGIQNYCDLTLNNMVVDGTNLLGDGTYTMSNNHGDITINNSTIIAKKGGVAFDVYYTPNYDDGVSVTVNNSTINGKIEVTVANDPALKDDAKKHKLTLTGGTLTGGLTAAQGAQLYNEGTTVISDVAMAGNTATDKGGAIFNSDDKTGAKGDLTLNKVDLKGNNANFGGAIWNEGTLTINGGSFEGNKADNAAGAIYNADGAKLTVDGVSFKENTAKFGGAINNAKTASGKEAATLTVKNSQFIGNTSLNSQGGAIRNQGTITEISGSTFKGNKASNGGAINNGEWGQIKLITNSVFDGNEATLENTAARDGGAILNRGTIESIADSTFTNNKTSGAGGAILNKDGASLTFNGTNTFTNNTAAGKANDIHNSGTITVASGTTTLNSGLILAGSGTVKVLNSTMRIGALTATGGTMFVDPAYVKIGSVAGDFGTQLLVGSGSTVNIGGMPEADMRQAMEKAGMSVGPNFTVGANQSVLVLGQALTLGGTGQIVVDADVTDTGSISGLPAGTTVATAHFGDGSLLVVNGNTISGATAAIDLSGATTKTLNVDNGAKLLITDAVAGQTYTVVSDATNTATAFNNGTYADGTGWKGDNLLTSSDMVTLTSTDGTVFMAKSEDAHTVFPDLSHELATAVNTLYGQKLNDVDSDAMGVRFLSRATDNRFLGADKKAAAESIESAARIAFAGAVPQMTRMASDAGTNAVVNRLGFADPADGAQAMDAEGKIVDRNTTGFALWIAPLWQSQHGWGLDAGNMDYGFNGNLGGVSLGADYTFENAIRAGITFNIGGGYAESSGGDLSSTENRMNFWGLGAYAGWNYENFGVMADVSYTSTWNDLQQDMDSRMGMGNKLEADVQATAISAGLRAEYLLQTSAMDIIPHIGVRYMSLNTWGYDVDTHGGTVLEGDSLHQDIWTFPIGVTFSKDFALDSGWSFKPSLDFTVIPAAGDIKAKHDVHFTGLPGTYEVETQMMDYLTWQGGIGLELANDNMSIGVNYTLQAGQHTTGHGVFGSFRYEF